MEEKIHPAAEQGRNPTLDAMLLKRGEEYDKLSDYSDKQLRGELIPLYRKMVDVWVANMGQAEDFTQQHFATLTDSVEIWNPFLDGSLPQAVVRKLTHEESKLYPLYEDIEKQVVRLRRELLK